jgi:TonB family protein
VFFRVVKSYGYSIPVPSVLAASDILEVIGTASVQSVSGDGRPVGEGGGAQGETPTAAALNPRPTYPAEALAKGIEGLVLLHVRINSDGMVQSVEVHRTSGNESLDDSALRTVRDRWQFNPARQSGIRVAWEGILPIRFRIRD